MTKSLLVGGTIAMLGLGFWKRDGISKRINHARADAHLNNAIEAGGEADWKRSERLCLAAWQLKQGDCDILRQLFTSARELKSKHLLIAASALFDHPESSPEDRLTVLDLHLEMGDYVGLKGMLTRLSDKELESPAAKHIGIRFFLARDDGRRALALTKKLLETRTDPGDLLLAAEVYARIPTRNNESQIEAQNIIFDLFLQSDDTSISLAAFSLLTNIHKSLWLETYLSEVEARLHSFRSEEIDIPLPVEFLAREIAMHLHPATEEEVIEKAIATYRDSESIALGEWFLRLNRPELVEKALTFDAARKSGEASQVLVRSLIAQEEWETASRFLSRPHPEIPPMVVMSLRAVVSEGLGQEANASSYWDRAFDHAKLAGGRSGLIELARVASAAGRKNIRNRALTEALKRPSSINLAAEDVAFLFAHLSDNDESDNLLAISRNLLSSEPSNPVLINNVTWLELVTGRTPGASTIGHLVNKHPEVKALRSTWTLALLAEGRNEEAFAAVAPLVMTGIGSPDLSPTDHAVIALAHLRNGSTEIAASAKSTIDWDRLMTVERRFFTEALSISTASITHP